MIAIPIAIDITITLILIAIALTIMWMMMINYYYHYYILYVYTCVCGSTGIVAFFCDLYSNLRFSALFILGSTMQGRLDHHRKAKLSANSTVSRHSNPQAVTAG